MTTVESTSSSRGRHVRPLLLIALAVAAIFLQWTPHQLRPFLRFDSGTFLYVGEQMRHGAALYRDVWDHKPPLIFYLNELGLTLGGGSPSGVLALDFVLVLLSFLTGYRLLSRLFSQPASVLATLLGVLLLFDLMLHPNLGEVACLPLQVLALFLLAKDLEGEVSLTRAGLQGGLSAALFWLRPNGIAISIVYLAIAGLMAYRNGGIRRLCALAAAFLATATICTAAIVTPAVLHSSWAELWFATFQFNQLYAGLATNVQRVHALLWLVFQAAQHGVILLAIAGLIVIPASGTKLATARDRFLWAIFFWSILEAFFSAYTGKLYGKNAIPWVLPAMPAIAIFFDALAGPERNSNSAKRTLHSLGGVSAAFLILSGLAQWRDNAKQTQSKREDTVIAEVQRLASPAEKIQFWGAFPMDTIFLAKRTSASRFFNSVPLMHGAQAYRQLAPTELDELLRNEPKTVVERDDGQIPPLLAKIFDTNSPKWDTPSLEAKKAKLSKDYRLAWTDEATHTRILVRQ